MAITRHSNAQKTAGQVQDIILLKHYFYQTKKLPTVLANKGRKNSLSILNLRINAGGLLGSLGILIDPRLLNRRTSSVVTLAEKLNIFLALSGYNNHCCCK